MKLWHRLWVLYNCHTFGHVWVHPLDYWTYVGRYEAPIPEISPDYCARCGLIRHRD